MQNKIPNQIKAVIFDVDGLMIDSEPAWLRTHDEFIARYNLDVSKEYRATFRGTGLKELVVQLKEKFQIDDSVENLLKEYREIFYRNFSQSGAMEAVEGVEEVVKYFFDKGFRLAIATGGHSVSQMQKMLNGFNLLKYFEVITSGDEVERGKPYPDQFLLASKRLSREPFECLVLEDSVNGVMAGKAAGMTVWGVNKDEKILNDLKKAGADRVFYRLLEMINFR